MFMIRKVKMLSSQQVSLVVANPFSNPSIFDEQVFRRRVAQKVSAEFINSLGYLDEVKMLLLRDLKGCRGSSYE